jgi:hypothetical protein
MPGILSKIWWLVRGVTSEHYRTLCDRCAYTGQAHWAVFVKGRFCHRFKPSWYEKYRRDRQGLKSS